MMPTCCSDDVPLPMWVYATPLQRIFLMLLVFAILATGVHVAWAKHRPGEYAYITTGLQSKSIHRQEAAIKLIDTLWHQPAHYALPYRIAYNWLPLLLQDGHDTTAAKLARENILAHSGATVIVGLCQIYRVEALLALNKNHTALRNAKSLFYVCPLGQTRTALLLLHKCLQRVYPQGNKLIKLFIREQMEGATKAGISCKVLSLIHINAKPYEKVLKGIHGTSQWALVEKGNLLLLMGRTNRAMRQMKLAAALNGNPQNYLADAGNVARALKAIDGTVYRANHYMLTAAHRYAMMRQ